MGTHLEFDLNHFAPGHVLLSVKLNKSFINNVFRLIYYSYNFKQDILNLQCKQWWLYLFFSIHIQLMFFISVINKIQQFNHDINIMVASHILNLLPGANFHKSI